MEEVNLSRRSPTLIATIAALAGLGACVHNWTSRGAEAVVGRYEAVVGDPQGPYGADVQSFDIRADGTVEIRDSMLGGFRSGSWEVQGETIYLEGTGLGRWIARYAPVCEAERVYLMPVTANSAGLDCGEWSTRPPSPALYSRDAECEGIFPSVDTLCGTSGSRR